MTERIRVRTRRQLSAGRSRMKKARLAQKKRPIDVAARIRQRRDRLLEAMRVDVATRINELRIGSFYELLRESRVDRG
jgi:hypothetical protein